jgi:hypothetical protein
MSRACAIADGEERAARQQIAEPHLRQPGDEELVAQGFSNLIVICAFPVSIRRDLRPLRNLRFEISLPRPVSPVTLLD